MTLMKLFCSFKTDLKGTMINFSGSSSSGSDKIVSIVCSGFFDSSEGPDIPYPSYEHRYQTPFAEKLQPVRMIKGNPSLQQPEEENKSAWLRCQIGECPYTAARGHANLQRGQDFSLFLQSKRILQSRDLLHNCRLPAFS